MRRRYDVDFGSLPIPGGFVIDLEGPDELQHEEDRRIMELLPDGGCWTSKDLVKALLQSVSDAVMGEDLTTGIRRCTVCGRERRGLSIPHDNPDGSICSANGFDMRIVTLSRVPG
jgi:hypothetical protein